jgi:DNA-binding MarR family transcriptional regulator
MTERLDAWELTDVLTRLRRALRASVRGEFPWESLPMAQVELLQRLAEEPDRRIGELAERHRLATNTVSTLIQQMVEAALVERRPDPRDRRAVTVRLTADGLRRLDAWRAAHERRLAAAMTEMASADRGVIITATGALARLAARLEAEDGTS